MLLDFLAARDRALLSGEREPILALLADNASQELRDRELALGRIAAARRARPPDRKIAGYEGGVETSLGLEVVTVLETDDQGRTRQVRYFLDHAGSTRLAEPPLDQLGELRTRVAEGFEVRYRDIDADQAEAVEGLAAQALAALLPRLGEEYRPRRPFTITLAPTTIAGLPAPASGFVNGSEITLLSSQSMAVEDGPAADWSRRVTTHEIAHVLLFQRGRGAWLLVEGIPLWLTDDRRQPELDRLVASDGIWDLAHLLEGPRDLEEFFAGYAQASSFVRYLATTYGDRAVLAAWEAGRTLRAEEALRAGLGVSATDAYAGWRASLRPITSLEDLRLAA